VVFDQIALGDAQVVAEAPNCAAGADLDRLDVADTWIYGDHLDNGVADTGLVDRHRWQETGGSTS
jgi:hypothetical protein